MKKFAKIVLLSLIFAFAFFSVSIPTIATPEASPEGKTKEATATTEDKTPAAISERQKELIEKVASREAQLREKRKKALFGEIKNVTSTTIVLATNEKENTVIINEDTKFTWIRQDKTRLPITTKDLEPGDRIAAVGTFLPNGSFEAKKIIGRLYSSNVNGVITSITKNTLVVTNQKQAATYTVNILPNTKIEVWQTGQGLTKGTPTSLLESQRVHINGVSKTKDKTVLDANRILSLPGLSVGITRPESSPSAKSS